MLKEPVNTFIKYFNMALIPAPHTLSSNFSSSVQKASTGVSTQNQFGNLASFEIFW